MTPPVNSITQAEDRLRPVHPCALDFESVFDGTERIGFTYRIRPGAYGWILGDGRTSTTEHVDREQAADRARTAHRR